MVPTISNDLDKSYESPFLYHNSDIRDFTVHHNVNKVFAHF